MGMEKYITGLQMKVKNLNVVQKKIAGRPLVQKLAGQNASLQNAVVQNAVVQKEEFDRYFIPLPVSCLLGKKSEKYIFSELEKRHPCFSNEFSYDSRLKISKKGFVSDVVVIRKLRLSQYRNFLGVKFAEDKGKRFISRKVKWLGIFAGLVLVLVTGLAVRGLAVRKVHAGDLPSGDLPSGADVGLGAGKSPGGQALSGAGAGTGGGEIGLVGGDLSSGAGIGFAGGKSPCGAGPGSAGNLSSSGFGVGLAGSSASLGLGAGLDFLGEMKNLNGHISNFSWKWDGFTEKITATVDCVYPEDFSDFLKNGESEISSINYVNGKPEFKLSVEKKSAGKKGASREETGNSGDFGSGGNNGRKKIRELFTGEKVNLISESYEPWKISFGLSDFGFLEKLEKLLNEEGIYLSEITMTKADKEKIQVEASFGEFAGGDMNVGLAAEKTSELAVTQSSEKNPEIGLEPNNLLGALSENMGLFIRKTSLGKNGMGKNAGNSFGKKSVKKTAEISEKIGEINYENGKKLVFYKDKNGKVTKILESE